MDNKISTMAGVDPNDVQIGGAHYKGYEIQPWDFFVKNRIPYLEACAIKYIVRHRDKNGKADIDKAIHYLEKLKDLEYE